MPTLSLRLIPATGPRTHRAGFLPGSETAAWLDEMARHPGARFYIVPNSVKDSQAGGLLIMAGDKPAFGPRVLPCAVEHGHVAVLATTRLDPALTTEEARRLLTYACYFFHPVLGLVAFEETDAIRPEALIVPLLPRAHSWLHAVSGHTPPPRLRRVTLTLPENFDDLFGDAAQDIGKNTPQDLQSNAPLLERLGDKFTKGAAAAGSGIMKAFGKILGAGSGVGSGGSGPIERLGRWAAEQQEKLDRLRQREMDRLMKMLENDPDAGLRYALPLTGDGLRGQSPPGWQLGTRNPTFGSHRGRGPVDAWNLGPDTRFRLQQKYRELANRELAAGRFDRAAYIYAELLGDWHSAAGALARGRRYQEAAQIYLEKLHNKPQAAKCLEDGGILADAVLLYAELGQQEKCGDLLRQLGREAEARLAYNEAIKGGKDRLHDARILFEKLDLPTLAIATLASGHPNSPQAAECLIRHFEYLTRLHASSDAAALARSLGDPARQFPDRALMARTLKEIHHVQPDAQVRHALGIVATMIIGEELSAPRANVTALLAQLPYFHSTDLLLKRDAQRYTTSIRQTFRREYKPIASPGAQLHPATPTHRAAIPLPKDDTVYHHLISQGARWLAIGSNERTRQDVWVLGDNKEVVSELASASGWGYQPPLLPIIPPILEGVWLPFCRPGDHWRYGQARRGDFVTAPGERDTMIDRLSWMSPGVLAAHADLDGVALVSRSQPQSIELSYLSYEGKLIRSYSLDWAPTEPSSPSLLAAHGDTTLFSHGPHLVRIQDGKVLNAMELQGRIVRLLPSRPVHAPAFLVVTTVEVVLVVPGKGSELDTVHLFSGESPHGCILSDGRIAIGDLRSTLVYSAHPATKLLASVPLTLSDNRKFEPWDFAAVGDRAFLSLNADCTVDWFE